MVEKRFTVLRIIAAIYKVLGWIILVVGTLVSLGIFISGLIGGAGMAQFMQRNAPLGPLMGGVLGGLVAGAFSFLLTLIYFVFTYGVGEIIYLFIAVEENTRAMSASLARWLQAPPNVPQPPSQRF
jgi:hypothetical protein